MRIIACLRAGIEKSWLQGDLRRLEEMQEADGGWPWSAMYRTRVVILELGNRGWNTALAMQAIKMMKDHKDHSREEKIKVEVDVQETGSWDGESEKERLSKTKTSWIAKVKQLLLCL